MQRLYLFQDLQLTQFGKHKKGERTTFPSQTSPGKLDLLLDLTFLVLMWMKQICVFVQFGLSLGSLKPRL